MNATLRKAVVTATVFLTVLVIASLVAHPAAAHITLPGSQATLMAGWDSLDVELDTTQPYVSRRFALYARIRPEQMSAADSSYSLSLVAVPGLGTTAVQQRGHLVRIAGSVYEWEGDIAVPTRGAWGLRFRVTRPDGSFKDTHYPMTVAAPNAIPMWQGWCLGLSPLLAFFAFGVWQARVLRRQLREEAAEALLMRDDEVFAPTLTASIPALASGRDVPKVAEELQYTA